MTESQRARMTSTYRGSNSMQRARRPCRWAAMSSEPPRDVHREGRHLQQLGRQEPRVAGDDDTRLVHHDRLPDPERAQRGRHLANGRLIAPRVAGIRKDPLERPRFDREPVDDRGRYLTRNRHWSLHIDKVLLPAGLRPIFAGAKSTPASRAMARTFTVCRGQSTYAPTR